MARNRIHIDAPPERVFAVLSEPTRYAEWVVGSATIDRHDPEFPAPGARFHHKVGLRPLALADHTEVVAAEPPHRLELKAKARPLGTADITLEMSPRAGGTEVLMVEQPGDRLTALVAGNRVADLALRLRNAEALSRLKRAVEERPQGRPKRRRELDGQRVLVTGGSSGIGLAAAELLAAEGARVALLARSEEGLEKARQRVEEEAGVAAADPVVTVAADVRDREAHAAAVKQVIERLGGLDVLVTAAAAASFGRFAETDPEDFDATVATVLGGGANSIRLALPHLEAASGAIVAIGSTAAHMPLPGLAAYASAKHGLAGLLDTLRIELRDAGSPVTVSLVNPGPVDTPFWNHLESETGLLPPVPVDNYSAAAIAAAVVATIRHPREEITVGGEAVLQVALFSQLRKPTSLALTALARMNQSGTDRPAEAGALRDGRGAGEVSGGHGGRGSLMVRALKGWDGLLRRAGAA